ncbi:MAG: butyrate kinase [Tidjanibacter sp.]|nr:butyrate kinase [Tidjanibacter sp.]
MEKMYKILTINPGSTSTKVAVFENDKELFSTTLRHSSEEIGRYKTILDQLDFRRDVILDAIKASGIELSELDAVIGRGGLLKPIPSGTYEVNAQMIEDIKERPAGQHASNLGALLASEIAGRAGVKAYIADPVVVDELQDVARLTGLPELERQSIFHALNQKAVARVYADKIGREYEELNLVVAHMGGGISIGAHRKGLVVDVNNALDGEGPFSPERAGTMPALAFAKMCMSGNYTLAEIAKKINGKGGVVAHLDTNDMREVENRYNAGDQKAVLVSNAMAYGVGKFIGQMIAVLKGEVDAVILTGGIAYDKNVVGYIKEMIEPMAKVVVMPGENELEALAMNAQRVLEGKLTPKVYE